MNVKQEGLRYFGMFLGVGGQLVTDVLEQPVHPIFKGLLGMLDL
jgi:hypothetical protein